MTRAARWLWCAMLAVATDVAQAQAIRGHVLDRATGKPLARVRVSIPDDSGYVDAHSDTLDDGAFTLVVPRAGRYQLHFEIAANAVLVSDAIAVGASSVVQRDFPLAVPADVIYADWQVEKRAAPVRGSIGPIYPAALRAAHVEGGLLAAFIIDTSGYVRPGSFTVVKATHEGFVDAVRTALAKMRFVPAMRDGHPVAQFTQHPFTFELTN